ncbi:MAG: tetratricopeptide repeat protein [Sphingobacteriaceae bacterium]|nr:tetratricopeptide repeat protein [Sphingobacteriaceae bacterium]
MEILKRAATLVIIITALQVKSAFSQADATIMKAFSTSYSEELKVNYTSAVKAISSVYNEKSYEMNLRLGWLYYLLKNYTVSANYYQKAVNLKNKAIEARFGVVKPLASLESWDRVMEQYDAILKSDPQNVQARYWKGMIYYNRKQYELSKQQFVKVITLYPFDYDSNHMMGWACLMLGKKAEAKSFFSQTLMVKPGDVSAMDGLNRSK